MSKKVSGFFSIHKEGFRVSTIIHQRPASRKQRLTERLDKFNSPDDLEQPMLRASNIQYELAGRSVGTAYGGIGLMHQLVQVLGLAPAINQRETTRTRDTAPSHGALTHDFFL